MTVLFCLGSYFVRGDHNVTEQQFAGIRIKTVLAVFLQKREIAGCLIIYHRKRQDIRWAVNLPLLEIDAVDFIVGL